MTIEILGSGTSNGIPVIGCSCEVCSSSNAHNKRLRASICIKKDDFIFLVDTSPDLRAQALRSSISRLDYVFYTHAHADHVNGIDDLRMFCKKGPLSVYTSAETGQIIHDQFSYAFAPRHAFHGTPWLTLGEVSSEPFSIGSLAVQPVPLWHGKTKAMGYRFDDMAYLTDCNEIPESSFSYLEHLEVLIIDALQFGDHPTHFSIEGAIEAGKRIKAKRTYLTDLCHDVEHEKTTAILPKGFYLAYDGLILYSRD